MTHRRTPSLLLLSLLAVACGDSTGEFGAPRTLPKDQRPTQWDVAAPQRLGAQQMGRVPSAGGFLGTTPAGWETQPPQPARFRDLVWRIAGDANTECYFTARTGGGVAMNLNRWYGQFGAPLAPAESLPAADLAGTQGRLLELSGSYNGKPGQAMMLVFTADGDSVTTLKFTGPEAVVKSNREQFLGLARSLRPGAEAPGQPAAPTGQQPQMPPDHPPMPADHPTAPSPNATAPFTATVPSGWTSKASTKALHHTFGADGEVYVAQLGGDVRAMFDIWRGEVGLRTPLSDAEAKGLPVVPMLGGEGQLLDVRGDWQGMSGKQVAGARMLVAARTEGGAIVFVKLVGKAADVETQVEAFKGFCNSLRRAP